MCIRDRDKVYRKNRKNIAVPGFRKGHAPRKIIEGMYGSGVFYEDAIDELYPNAYAPVSYTHLDVYKRQVRVHIKVKEGNRERIQVFEGTVIAKKHGGVAETFTVRRVSYGVGVEKVFPLHSPIIEKIETVRAGKVRRAKLYYLRDRVGKSAKIKEKL